MHCNKYLISEMKGGNDHFNVDFNPTQQRKRSPVPLSNRGNSRLMFREFKPNESSFKINNPFYQTSMFDSKLNKLDQIGSGQLSRLDTTSLEMTNDQID